MQVRSLSLEDPLTLFFSLFGEDVEADQGMKMVSLPSPESGEVSVRVCSMDLKHISEF